MNQGQFVMEVFRIMREEGPLISEGDKLFWRENFGSGLIPGERQKYNAFYGAEFDDHDFINPKRPCQNDTMQVLHDYKEFAQKLREEEKQGRKSQKTLYAAQMAFIILMDLVFRMYRI